MSQRCRKVFTRTEVSTGALPWTMSFLIIWSATSAQSGRLGRCRSYGEMCSLYGHDAHATVPHHSPQVLPLGCCILRPGSPDVVQAYVIFALVLSFGLSAGLSASLSNLVCVWSPLTPKKSVIGHCLSASGEGVLLRDLSVYAGGLTIVASLNSNPFVGGVSLALFAEACLWFSLASCPTRGGVQGHGPPKRWSTPLRGGLNSALPPISPMQSSGERLAGCNTAPSSVGRRKLLKKERVPGG